MKLKAIRSSTEECPAEVRPFLASSIPVTISSVYEAHGATNFNGVTLFQIVDDLGYPSWQPSWLFEVMDMCLANDWCCNVLSDGSIVVGPLFVVESDEAYSSMVELDASQVDRFWTRIKSHEQLRSQPS